MEDEGEMNDVGIVRAVASLLSRDILKNVMDEGGWNGMLELMRSSLHGVAERMQLQEKLREENERLEARLVARDAGPGTVRACHVCGSGTEVVTVALNGEVFNLCEEHYRLHLKKVGRWV